MRALFFNRKTISKREKQAVSKFLFVQFCIGLLICAASYLFFGVGFFKSSALGAMVTVLPNLFLVVFLFTRLRQKSAKQVRRACLVGEALKILLIAVLVIAILQRFQVLLWPFLLGLLGTYGVYWFAPIIIKDIA